MKAWYFSLCTCFVCLLIGVSVAAGIIQYELAPEKIKEIRLRENSKGSFSALIELTEAERENFSNLTQANVGQELQVNFSGQPLTRARVMAPITSGIIHAGKWDTEDEARAVFKDMRVLFTNE